MAIHALTKLRLPPLVRYFAHVCGFPSPPPRKQRKVSFNFSQNSHKVTLTAKQSIMPKADPVRGTSGGNISNSHLPGLSPNFIPGILKPRDATACTGKTTFRWPPFCAGRKGKLSRAGSTSASRFVRVACLVFPGRTFIFIRVCCFHGRSDKRMQKSVYGGARRRRDVKKRGIHLRRFTDSSRVRGVAISRADRDRLRAEARREGREIAGELISFSITVSCLAAHQRFGTTNKSPRPRSLRLAIIRRKWPGRWWWW